MSGIYIPGMEMPTSCSECGVRHEAKCSFYYELLNENEDLYDFRKPDCPLVPVPEHGRLIDADALRKSDRLVGKMMMFGGEYVYTQTEIDRAPTIIPADKEGE